MKKIILISIALLLSNFIYAQTPNWTNFSQRQQLYPQSEYFIGFSMNNKHKEESQVALLEKLSTSAVEELVSTVQVTVESVTTQIQSEVNDKLSSSFKSASTSFSKIELTGLKTETYYDKRKKMGYALAYVNKQDLIDYYIARLDNLSRNIAGKIDAAEQYISNNDEENALKAYYNCMPMFREAESAYTIVMLLRASKEQIAQINKYEVKVKKGIESVYHSDNVSLPELCSFLSYGLIMQTGVFNDGIRMGSFTYEDTRMSSSFSRRFIVAFQKELIEEAGYKIRIDSPKPGSKEPDYILGGTYWQDGEDLKVITILRNVKTGKPIASTEGYLPISWLKKRDISFKPENFGQAAENMKKFKTNEIINGGMQLDVWTSNKGNDSPIFEEDDELEIYVRVSHPCFIRIINHFADGTRVLLVDNMYLGTDKINKVVTIPVKFYCAPPFGTEILQVNAQTKEFNPLHLKSEYGYDFILDDLDGILSNTRGFKRKSNEDLKAEKRVVVTTMKRISGN